jgi:hypothetical protein
MSAEASDYRGSFNQFEGFGELAEQHDTAIIALFDARLRDDEDLMDVDLEFAQPELADHADYLATVLNDGHVTDGAKKVAYRAIHFALLTADRLTSGKVSLQLDGYYDDVQDVDATKAKIQADTQEYLIPRPALNFLIGYYLEDIDPSTRYDNIAETVAALVFLRVETSLEQEFIDAEIIDAEVAAFAADLPEAM